MKVKVFYEKTLWVDVDKHDMTAKEFMQLRDTDEGLYDQILDDAFDKAIAIIGNDPTHGDCTFLDVDD